MTKRKQYVGRVHLGHGKYRWVGRFNTRRERDAAVARARVEIDKRRPSSAMTCGEWAERFLARYDRTRKGSSADTARAALTAFLRDFGDRPLFSVERIEAMDWAQKMPRSRLAVVVTMFNEAKDAELIDRNPFRGLTPRTKGRSEERPPTAEEFSRLVDACSALGWYAPQMRALLIFAAYSGMRPGELYGLEWADVDFDAMRILVSRGVYKGRVDTPKSGKSKLIALTPPARDALLGLPSRGEGGLVFRSKEGRRLSQPIVSGYWKQVRARAGLDFAFYLATKHYCVHYLWAECRLSPRAIAQQMGWSLRTVDKMLAIYGHGEVGALEEVDRAFADTVVPIRDAAKTQRGSGRAG